MPFDFEKMKKEIPEGTDFTVPLFVDYMIPNGFLGTAPEEHALFYYYVNARRTYEEFILNQPIQMEDESDPQTDFRQLFTSIAALYGCKPENMVNAWSTIDRQCDSMGLPKMPNEYQYRFVNTSEILVQ